MEYMFHVPGRAVPKARPRLGAAGHVYTPTPTRRYEEAVAWCAIAAGVRLRPGDRIAVACDFWLCPVTGDVDNRIKSILDGLQRAFPLWDDRLVERVTGRQVQAERKDDERTLIRVEVLG